MLNVPHKVDWKKCQLSKEEEVTDTKAFRDGFKAFDFNLKK